MDTELDPLGLVQIAEEIENRRMRWYERIAPLCADAASSDLCRELLAWSDRQANRLTGLRVCLRTAAPPHATTCPGNFLSSNARVMAALAFFVAERSAPDLPAAVTRAWMLTDTVHACSGPSMRRLNRTDSSNCCSASSYWHCMA